MFLFWSYPLCKIWFILTSLIFQLLLMKIGLISPLILFYFYLSVPFDLIKLTLKVCNHIFQAHFISSLKLGILIFKFPRGLNRGGWVVGMMSMLVAFCRRDIWTKTSIVVAWIWLIRPYRSNILMIWG